MSLTVNNVQSNAYTNDTSFSYNAGTESNRILVAVIGIDDQSDHINSMTYNSVAMTRLDWEVTDISCGVEVFYLADPASGTNTLAVDATGFDGYIQATFYISGDGVLNLGASAAANGDDSHANTNITPQETGSLLIAGIASNDSAAMTEDAGCTEVFDQPDGADSMRGGVYTKTSTSTDAHNLGATVADDRWAIIAFEIYESQGSASISASVSPTPSASISPSPSPSISPSVSPTPSASVSPTPSASVSPTPSPSVSASVSPTPSASESASYSISSSPSISPTPSASVSPSPSPSPEIYEKTFTYKIYNDSDGAYLTTWSNEVISEPYFASEINGGPGQLKVVLDRAFEDFGEGDDVDLNNKVKCYVYDTDNQEGLLLYTGYISDYTPVLDSGREVVEILVLPYVTELSRFMLREANGDTEVAFLSQDPTTIFNGVLSRFQNDGGSLDGGDIETTGTTVSYTFNTNTCKQAVDKCIELAPDGWFWSVDPDGKINFKQKSATVDHDLLIGEHITSMYSRKRIENLVNRVYFTGGGEPPLFMVYERTGSIDAYGLYAKSIVDQRVTVEATAETIATRILDANEEPETRLILRIADNNGSTGQGYDIESISVGDTVRIKNLQYGTQGTSLWDVAVWDVDVWDYTLASTSSSPLLVVRTRYNPNYMEIETSSRLPEVAKRIEDVNRNLVNTQTKDNPTSPS